MILTVPKFFNSNGIITFIKDSSMFFQNKGKRLKGLIDSYS